MSAGKKGSTEATMLGLPEVAGANSTQVLDETVRDPASVDSTAPSLPPVASPPVVVPPPRTRTGGVRTSDTINDAPRSKSSGAVPRAPEPERRPSRVAQKPLQLDAAPSQADLPDPAAHTDPGTTNPVVTAVTAPSTRPVKPPFEWTMPRVAGVAGGVSLLFVLLWVFWPSGTKPRPQPVTAAEPVEDLSQPRPLAPKPAPRAVPTPAEPKAAKPVFSLDAKKHVVDPYGTHLEDQPLDPAHKYRLRIERDDARLGTALARLEEKGGWGVMRKMASHAALQFGGVKTLRMHCEPGSRFADGQLFPLELTDLATKKAVPIKLSPRLHCWDFEVMRVMELGEGVKRRIRVPTDSPAKLGEQVPLKIVYVLEALGEKLEWKTGVLGPGESVLAEGRMVRFGILDPYATDNEGSVDLELLSGDTESSGLVTPSSESGAKFVPANK